MGDEEGWGGHCGLCVCYNVHTLNNLFKHCSCKVLENKVYFLTSTRLFFLLFVSPKTGCVFGTAMHFIYHINRPTTTKVD